MCYHGWQPSYLGGFANLVIKNSWRVKTNLVLNLQFFYDQIGKTRPDMRDAVNDDTFRGNYIIRPTLLGQYPRVAMTAHQKYGIIIVN